MNNTAAPTSAYVGRIGTRTAHVILAETDPAASRRTACGRNADLALPAATGVDCGTCQRRFPGHRAWAEAAQVSAAWFRAKHAAEAAAQRP